MGIHERLVRALKSGGGGSHSQYTKELNLFVLRMDS